jgi:polysaccharide pyruvyl transferase WcaK-like protein
MSTGKTSLRKIGLYGHFGAKNFGNESTLHAMLYHLRRMIPDAEITCICTVPEIVAGDYQVAAVPMSAVVFKFPSFHNPLVRLVRKLCIGVPNELYRWLDAFTMLKRTDILIIPGTGLLTDAYGLGSWGPYGLFKWSLMSKLRGCKLFFVSVGAGPNHSRLSRWLVKATLALADGRSYRDKETREYLDSIGVAVARDKVYPDLAFSIAEEITPQAPIQKRRRRVVGLGLMLYHGKLSSDKPSESTCEAYLQQLVIFVKWLLSRDYDVRLLIGDLSDRQVVAKFKTLLQDRLAPCDEDRIMDDPIDSVESLLVQLAGTDAVVATRFHNVLWALALNKPVISISFHQKCTSLMHDMGLEDYYQDIHQLNADKLMEQFCQLEKSAGCLKQMIGEKVAQSRAALDEQYRTILKELEVR